MADLYLITAAPMPTTAATGTVATGTAIKTLMQVKPGTQTKPKIVEWGHLLRRERRRHTHQV